MPTYWDPNTDLNEPAIGIMGWLIAAGMVLPVLWLIVEIVFFPVQR